LVIATNNPHKAKEFRRLLAGLGWELVTPAELGISLDVAEDGASFQENARLKAVTCANATGLPSLSDDSGIEVEALGGGPGIHSARYGGPGLSDRDRMFLLVDRLRDVPWEGRRCRYVAALVLAWPDGRDEAFEGICDGTVALAPAGANGFGYDPVFYLPQAGLTIAQLSDGEKNAISHRGRAARQAVDFLRRLEPAAQSPQASTAR
jgi:XTP/dITP diphosphohydrolase